MSYGWLATVVVMTLVGGAVGWGLGAVWRHRRPVQIQLLNGIGMPQTTFALRAGEKVRCDAQSYPRARWDHKSGTGVERSIAFWVKRVDGPRGDLNPNLKT